VPGQGDVLRDADTRGYTVMSGGSTKGCDREPVGQKLIPTGCYHGQKPAQLGHAQYAQTQKEGGCVSPGAHMERPERPEAEQVVHVSAES